MDKGIIYYTDNLIEEPIKSVVQEYLSDSGLPIISASLKEIEFGKNVVVKGERGYPTMVRQIVEALKLLDTKYVFFCEHDVLYPQSHFDFTPLKDDIFYYNENVWRWAFGTDMAVQYDRMLPLSCLCANREFTLNHYLGRQKLIEEGGLNEVKSKEPEWVRKMGYEPGTKKKKRGGFSDDDFETFRSEFPVIDIRHEGTFSPPKVSLSEFKHAPKWFKEIPVEEVDGWDLKGVFQCN